MTESEREVDDLDDLAMDLYMDESAIGWREQTMPLADWEDAAGFLPHERRPMSQMHEDLSPTKPDDPGKCKVEGCWRSVAQEKGPYGGLCSEHRAERKAERAAERIERNGEAHDQAVAEAEAAQNDGPIRVRDRKAMEELLVDLVMLDDSDLDLPQLRLEAARLLLGDRR